MTVKKLWERHSRPLPLKLTMDVHNFVCKVNTVNTINVLCWGCTDTKLNNTCLYKLH